MTFIDKNLSKFGCLYKSVGVINKMSAEMNEEDLLVVNQSIIFNGDRKFIKKNHQMIEKDRCSDIFFFEEFVSTPFVGRSFRKYLHLY